jgi:hypothetical protein
MEKFNSFLAAKSVNRDYLDDFAQANGLFEKN